MKIHNELLKRNKVYEKILSHNFMERANIYRIIPREVRRTDSNKTTQKKETFKKKIKLN